MLAAIEHAADSVVVRDRDGIVRYVNRSFEQHTGRPRDELIGQRLRIFDRDSQVVSDRQMRAAIRRGQTWTGEVADGRPDGSIARAIATVAPIRDRTGAVVGTVAVKRDISRERALEERLVEYNRERTALAEALQGVVVHDSPEATAAAICRTLVRLPNLAAVGVMSFREDGSVSQLALVDEHGAARSAEGPLPTARSAYLRERAEAGPWIENWQADPSHPYNPMAIELEIRSIAYAPIRGDGGSLGLVVAGGRDPLEMAERLPAVVECASVAAAVLGPQLRMLSVQAAIVARIRSTIAERTFVPVFQPIVDLASRAVVGYEALTRFADGRPADVVFAEAASVGLAVDLELATLETVLEGSGQLPASAWLNLNVSPDLVLSAEPLEALLSRWGWRVVLELTEHVEVADYGLLRAAIKRLGPNVKLAVDDAGAGFSSFRHILELRPDYVKLDRTIVHAIGRDPARQALVAGMAHFAGRTGATLIGEGVETEAEARELFRLGVRLGQGYHLGRPALAGRLVRLSPEVALPRPSAPLVRHRPNAPGGQPDDDIGRAVNVGTALAAGLRDAGITSAADLRAAGAIPAFERLRRGHPRLATGATLLSLEGAVRGVRVTQLSPGDRARLRLFAKLGRRAP